MSSALTCLSEQLWQSENYTDRNLKPAVSRLNHLAAVFPKVVAIVAAYCLLPQGLAQTPKLSNNLPPNVLKFKLASVQVLGTSHYKLADVMHAANLQVGQTFHENDLKIMVRLLGESGAFASVSYSAQFEPDGARVRITLRDADRFFPAYFDNLVWFTDGDLFEKLHSQVPLFDGQLPVNGGMASEIYEALQLLLFEKNVPGQIEYMRPFDDDNPEKAFVFAVRGLNITIRNVEFSGASAPELQLLTSAAKRLAGTEYRRSGFHEVEDNIFLPIYREHGYLKALLGNPQPTVVQNDAHDTQVDVLLPVQPGRQYRLARIQISGNKNLPNGLLRTVFHVQDGEIANVIELDKELATIPQVCRTRGYMDASVKAEFHTDDTKLTVLYNVSIVEGETYKMGEMEIRGLDFRTTERLENDWTLRNGDIYDASYVGRFIEQAYKEIGNNWHASVHESVDPRTKTVDVSVRFLSL